MVTSKVGALSAFTQKKETCLGCKSVLPKGYENEAVCSYCKPKETAIYQQELSHHRMLEGRFAELFTGNLYPICVPICRAQGCFSEIPQKLKKGDHFIPSKIDSIKQLFKYQTVWLFAQQ